jgi:hypothetical protein
LLIVMVLASVFTMTADARRARNAVVGAAIGTGIGALVDGSPGARTGAVVGAIVGAVADPRPRYRRSR